MSNNSVKNKLSCYLVVYSTYNPAAPWICEWRWLLKYRHLKNQAEWF